MTSRFGTGEEKTADVGAGEKPEHRGDGHEHPHLVGIEPPHRARESDRGFDRGVTGFYLPFTIDGMETGGELTLCGGDGLACCQAPDQLEGRAIRPQAIAPAIAGANHHGGDPDVDGGAAGQLAVEARSHDPDDPEADAVDADLLTERLRVASQPASEGPRDDRHRVAVWYRVFSGGEESTASGSQPEEREVAR